MSSKIRLCAALAAAATISVLALGAAPASAAGGWNCDATVLRGTVLTAPPLELITANRNQPACRPVTSTLADLTGGLPLPLGLSSVLAQTNLVGPADDVGAQSVSSIAGVKDLSVGSLPNLPITLPPVDIPSTLSSVPVTLPSLPALGALPTAINVLPQVQALVPNLQLPTTDLVHIGSAYAQAAGYCNSAGQPQLAGIAQLANLSVLGQSVATDQVTDRTVPLVGGGVIDPSNANVLDILTSNGLPNLAPVRDAVQTALDALPDIPIPETLAHVRITPGAEVRQGDSLIERALQIQADIAGQNLVDLVLGEATVSSAGVQCDQVAPAALQCSTRKIVLIDVLPSGDKVKLLGAADRRYIGQKVRIVFTHTGRTVATPTVGPDGLFRATARMPEQSIRATNLARYQASIANDHSLRLKLMRRMVVEHVARHGSLVTIEGRVVKPLADPVQSIVVKRRVSCTRSVVVKRIQPDSRGRFTVTVPAPDTQQAGVYRLETKVRKNTHNPKLFPTFTLPRFVEMT